MTRKIVMSHCHSHARRQRVLISLFLSFEMLLILGFLPQMTWGQASRTTSTRDKVYTFAQSQQGKAIYEAKCSMCHGNALEGIGANSPLAGDSFLKNWTARSMEDLLMKTITMMPATAPGTLSPEQTAQVLAYLLQVNQFPAGQKELSCNPRELNLIRIDPPNRPANNGPTQE